MQADSEVGGFVPSLGGEALLELAGGRAALGEVVVEDWERLPGSHLDPGLMWQLREHVAELAGRSDTAGIVVTHGTDTLEETAYVLARTLPRDAPPVVITGAMRTAGADDWDGARNLRDAIRVARHPAARGRGTLVVFAGTILRGASVAKVHTTALNAFAAPHAAPAGTVTEQGISFGDASLPVASKPVSPRRGLLPRVAVVMLVTGDAGELLDAARPGAEGLVLVAFGAGNVPPGAVAALARWRDEEKPVVLASRCAAGVVEAGYGFRGGNAALLALGLLPAGARTIVQARFELMLSLSAGVPYDGRNGG